MHIIIVGGGRVGGALAQTLAAEQQDVYVIEQDEKTARELDDRLDVQVVHGTGFSQAVLFRAGIQKADLLLAVTHSDETNLIAAMTAERLAPGCRTVCRIRDPRFMLGTDALRAEEYGVDFLISPEQAVAEEVMGLLQYDGPGGVSTLADGKLILLEFPVQPHSTLAFATVAELAGELPAHSVIVACLSGDTLRIVDDSDRFQVGDRVLALSVPGEINDILLFGGSDPHHVTRVLLIGGGETAMHLAGALLRRKYDVTLVESDAGRAEEIAARLDKCTVIHGDGTAPAELAEYIRDGREAVVVLVDDDSKSLLAGITAKHHGAKKVIARVINQDYGTIARSAGIDALISPPRAMSNSILHFSRRSSTVSTIVLGNHIGELIDFELGDKVPKKLGDQPVGKIKLPAGARIGAILRKDEIIVPDPETTHLKPKDQVFVVALRAAVGKVEELFD